MRCSFCNKEIPKGTGLMYVKVDGKILYLCGGRCRKSMLVFNRKPQNTKWITKKQGKRKAKKTEKKEEKKQ